jgi:cytochrome c-type biogenesis protein CcsB
VIEGLSQFSFTMALGTLVPAVVLYLVSIVPNAGPGAVAATGGMALHGSRRAGPRVPVGRYATLLTTNAFVFLSAALVARTVATGHGPFADMFEFSLAFSWAAVGLYLYFEFRYQIRTLAIFVLPVALGLLVYATTVPRNIEPLVPALQNNLLLSTHVAVAVIAYGAFTVAFAAAVLSLIQQDDRIPWLPPMAKLDEIGYRAVLVGFPMLALVIILGAVWAEIAWGTYWSWDPKETASLATWLIYGGYLHARVVRSWRGQRSALLLIAGFGATLLTYYGNLFFGGMHSYA